MNWHDERLTWYGTAHNHYLHKMTFPYKRIWIPDITLLNGQMIVDQSHIVNYALVYQNGSIQLRYKARFEVNCLLQMDYFPLDQQICHVKIGSWSYHILQVNATQVDECATRKNWINHGQWSLVSFTASRLEEHSFVPNHALRSNLLMGTDMESDMNISFSGIDDHLVSELENTHPHIAYHVILRRKPKFFIVNLLFPTGAVVILAVVAFYTPTKTNGHRDQKLLISLTTILTLTSLLLVVSQHVPPSRSIPLITMYYYLVMFCLMLAATFTPLIIYLQKKGYVFNQAAHPAFKYFVVTVLQRMTFQEWMKPRKEMPDMRIETDIKRPDKTSHPALFEILHKSQPANVQRLGQTLYVMSSICTVHWKRLKEKIRVKKVCEEWQEIVSILERAMLFGFMLVMLTIVCTIMVNGYLKGNVDVENTGADEWATTDTGRLYPDIHKHWKKCLNQSTARRGHSETNNNNTSPDVVASATSHHHHH